jgi:hypothetical protein
MSRTSLLVVTLLSCLTATAQEVLVDSTWINDEIKVTIDRPAQIRKKGKTIVIFYALPNGNTTAQTMGKVMEAGDDWHFDIQHIKAQTAFIRNQNTTSTYIVVYLENKFKSWPTWKQQHPNNAALARKLIDSIAASVNARSTEIYLNGHSGGGSLLFAYLSAPGRIPQGVKRLSFIDSDYGYDSSYYLKINDWLRDVKSSVLTVMAYNDSIAVYNGKLLVSARGGTWYRSHLLLSDLETDHKFEKLETDSLIIYKSSDRRMQFYFKKNTDRGIYHTQQVELNGFIHSVFCATKFESKGYDYYGKRAYSSFIR